MITKKEFKSLADIHVYGTGSKRRVRLFYDWKQSLGFKYMLIGYGVTKDRILTDAYDILIKKDTYYVTFLLYYTLNIIDTNNTNLIILKQNYGTNTCN